MNPPALMSNSYRKNLSVAAVCSFGITFLWFWLTWRWGVDFADEGYYWYGAQRVLLGEVPLRDFASYDIGRYYWAASFMHFMGDDGIFAVRLSAAIYQMLGTLLGVFICLLALHREGLFRWLFALVVACNLTLWIRPYYKAYDHATSIAVIAIVVLILKSTKPAAWLMAGVCLGLAAIMGRNHGLYGAAASILVVALLFMKTPERRTVARLCGHFALGVLIGYSPVLIMMLSIDGFMAAFINSIVLLVKYGATNIALPVPWPWNVKLDGTDLLLTVQNVFIGISFIFLIIYPLLGIRALALSRFDLSGNAQRILLATTSASILYGHYAFSRADIAHLALGIFPAMIGLLAASASLKGIRPLMLAVALLGISLLTAPPRALHGLLKNDWVTEKISGEQLWIRPDLSKKLQLIRNELYELDSHSKTFLAIPDMIAIHAIFHARMAIYDIYPIVPREDYFDLSEINRIESVLPEVVLLSDHALDGNPKFRYSALHPVIYEWLTEKYELSETNKIPGIDIYRIRPVLPRSPITTK